MNLERTTEGGPNAMDFFGREPDEDKEEGTVVKQDRWELALVVIFG